MHANIQFSISTVLGHKTETWHKKQPKILQLIAFYLLFVNVFNVFKRF